MPADLTAPQLIAILREHPGACLVFGLTFSTLCDDSQLVWTRGMNIMFSGATSGTAFENVRFWLVGAAVEKCDELGIEIVRYADGFGTIERHVFKPTTFGGGTGIKIGKKHPTRLHAALAAIEAHAKEKSNG